MDNTLKFLEDYKKILTCNDMEELVKLVTTPSYKYIEELDEKIKRLRNKIN